MVAVAMTTRKPQRVHVQIRNPLTGTSKTITLYGVDEVQAAEQIRRMVEGRECVGIGAAGADDATAPTR